jgi:antirestriction protein ArdC
MAVTNAELIENATIALMMEGKIGKGEEIHTYAHWKELGYQVKKGEKAVAKFQVWKPSKRKPVEGEPERAEARPRMFRKMASFFSTAQVDPITQPTT